MSFYGSVKCKVMASRTEEGGTSEGDEILLKSKHGSRLSICNSDISRGFRFTGCAVNQLVMMHIETI
ncbi:hypothetical protein B7P43_G16598 [Cryptotermes secundus]|uniref:Uncharacterized protein n=1 Tax=Cryptotermes secundus TaxID=105785 RepID=A0A2J7Q1E0_9NEOP|nr:hypothetical protein B7P43_G16598 [Cryptotermes secundus]